ncbi:MAG: TonB-dependent receptor plug domain-containing protein [Pseudomonadales bacterium]|nr:TonB-dependent receptor plug domain-containing protein [Pseudomonadales bacterium]
MSPVIPAKKSLIHAIALASAMQAGSLMAQDAPVTDDDSTVTYPASYFAQFEPFSANDMLDRIPGISVARSGGSNTSSDSSRRGLGLGGDQILINGRRITGKGNEGNSQLSRIPADQVQHIEIIRGTSADLDVRGGSQVINIVLLEAESRSSVAYELNADHYHDGEVKPGGKISLTGSRGAFEYLLSAETEPRWEWRKGFEVSTLADGSLNNTIARDTRTDSQPLTLSANLGYQFSDSDIAHLNIQYEDTDSPFRDDRFLTDYQVSPIVSRVEEDITASSNEFWEVGGDYEHSFANGNRWKTLWIVNRKEDDSLRERFVVDGADRSKDLFLDNYNRYQERIIRSSYSMGLTDTQDIEFGLERAQTILDSTLKLGLLSSTEPGSAEFGGLTPFTNANATVEEIRYEASAVHNWQINSRMSLESTLIFEQSEISQSGDVSKSRDFDFVRPKIDYRFDLTPSLQFRATIEKDVAQLSFNDFTANTDSGDDEQNEVTGNPDLRQEQSWRYDLNLEYRFNNDNGVINSNVYFHDLEDVIDRIDVSTGSSILSANGNIGDGERYGAAVDGSLRLAGWDLPNILLTSRVEVVDSSVTDPFLGIDRRLNRGGRGSWRLGFRHDVSSLGLNYGVNYNESFEGGILAYDIDKIEDYDSDGFLLAFVEKQGWGGLIYRFEATNVHESYRCRIRTRFVNGTIATGNISEIEDSCSHTGEKYAIKIRGTF